MHETRFRELFSTFLKIGIFTFGGGFAMIPLIEREIIDKRKWLPKSEFMDLLTLAQSAPGAIALNTAVFIGYKTRGYKGALASLLGVVLPSFLIIIAIALFFSQMRENMVVDAAFKGMRPVVIALIVAPIINIACAMKPYLIALAVVLAAGLWYFELSPIYTLLASAIVGLVWAFVIGKMAKQ